MDDQKDAERYRKLRAMLYSADFTVGVMLVFQLPDDARVSANLDATLDAL